MISSENELGLPRDWYNFEQVQVGNLASRELKNHDKRFKAQYISCTGRIEILNSSNLSVSIFNKIFYESPVVVDLDKYAIYPRVYKKNKKGNIEFHLSPAKPSKYSSEKPLTKPNFDVKTTEQEQYSHSLPTSLGFIAQDILTDETVHGLDYVLAYGSLDCSPPAYFDRNLKDCIVGIDDSFEDFSSDIPSSSVEIKENIMASKEIKDMQNEIAASVIDTMSMYFNKHVDGNGIWCPNDYQKYLIGVNKEMEDSYYTGYANGDFFEKTDFFTFKIKEGKKASEALLSFLKGPTVADCGNATMACYYKCLLDILGIEKFDQIFSSNEFALVICPSGKKSPIYFLLGNTEDSNKKEKGLLGKRPLNIGDECHFGGVKWYGSKHPAGHGVGWNVIYIGDNEKEEQLFMGHGLKKPLTEVEIYQRLIALYNLERTPLDKLYILLKGSKKELKSVNNMKKYYTIPESEKNIEEFIGGFVAGSGRNLNAKSLIRLKKSKDVFNCMVKQILL